MTPLTNLFTLMVAISMAVERVVEILKGIFPVLSKTWTGDKEYARFALLHVLATVAGSGVAFAAHSQIANQVPMLSFEGHPYVGYAVIGLMASGGSAMWNHALDIAQAVKIKQVAANPPAPNPAVVPGAGQIAPPVVRPAGG